MPVQITKSKDKVNKRIKAVKEQLKLEEDLQDDISKRARIAIESSFKKFSRIRGLSSALNKLLGLFGTSINISGIKIEDVVDAYNTVEAAVKKKKDTTEQDLEALEAAYGTFIDLLNDSVSDYFEQAVATGDTEDLPSYFDATDNMIEKHRKVRTSARNLDQVIDKLALLFTNSDQLGEDVLKIVESLKSIITNIVDIITTIIETVSDILIALQGAAIPADLSPFNTLPGSLGVCGAYLIEVSNSLKDLARELLDVSNITDGISDSALRVTVLLKSRLTIIKNADEETEYVGPEPIE